MQDGTAIWESFLNRINANVTDHDMKEQLVEAVRIMRRHLGEDWPSEAKSDNLLRWSLGNISGAVSDYLLAGWGDAISATEGSVGFGRMMAKLRVPGRLESRIAELETAGRLAGRGCRVQFEPEVGCKRPDLLCRCDGSEFLVEVKMLETAPQIQESMKTAVAVIAACRPMFPAGSIFRILSGLDLEKAAGALRQAADRAISYNVPQEVYIPNDLKAYLVPDGLPDRVRLINEWRGEQKRAGMMPRDWDGRMYGPPYRTRVERRIRDRINKMARERQIPSGETGVLVVKGSFFFADADAAKQPVAYITKALPRIRNVPAVVLVSDKIVGGSGKPAITDRQGFAFIRNRLHEMVYEDVVIIWNPYCEPGLDHDLLKRLLATGGGSVA